MIATPECVENQITPITCLTPSQAQRKDTAEAILARDYRKGKELPADLESPPYPEALTSVVSSLGHVRLQQARGLVRAVT